MNNGTCTNSIGSYACDCDDGFTGGTCDEGKMASDYTHNAIKSLVSFGLWTR